MMWAGAGNMTRNTTAFQALKMLIHDIVLKLDTLLDQEEKSNTPDPGVLAIYDVILAAKYGRFLTCTRACGDEVCAQCNHHGIFMNYAVEYRKSQGKMSDICWPH